MTDLPAEMKNLGKLRSIILNHNRYASVCSFLVKGCGRPTLYTCNAIVLRASRQQQACSVSCCSVAGLTLHIYSSNHRFKSFPEVLYHIVSLETILLGNNQVDVVDPRGLMKLSSLSTLDLSNNDILKVPPELGLCSSLRCVAASVLRLLCWAQLRKQSRVTWSTSCGGTTSYVQLAAT